MDDEKQFITYNPSDEELKELTYVYERWETMKGARGNEEAEWKEDEDQYMMTGVSRDPDSWKADLKLPDTTAAILAAIAETVDQNPSINYLPRNSVDTKSAEKFNAAFKYTWEKGQGQLELIDHFFQTSIFGTAIGKEYWCIEKIAEKEVSEYEKDENDQDTHIPKTWKKGTRTVFDDCRFKSIYIKNFWADEAATNMGNAVDCIELELMNEDLFHEKYDDMYKNAKLAQGKCAIEYDWYEREEAEEKIEVIYYYNKARDMFSIMANGILLTKPGNPNPYQHKELPYVSSVFIPRVKSFYGMGLPRLVRHLQQEKNTVRNMGLDAAKLNINNLILVDERLELDDADLEIQPNQIIKGAPGSIEVVKGPPVNPSRYKEEELLTDDIIRATGVDPRMQTLGGKGDTATEIAILKESSIKRIRFTLKLIEQMSLYRVGRLRISNMQQFYKIPKFRDILDDEGNIEQEATYPTIGQEVEGKTKYFEFKPNDQKGEYDIVVVTGATLPVSKALESQKRINLFDRLKGHPDINQRKLAEELIKAHDIPSGDLMTKEGEPPMGAGQSQEQATMPMPGQGQGAQGETEFKAQDVAPARQFDGVNVNQ